MALQGCVLSPQVWAMASLVFGTLGLFLANVLLTKAEAIGYYLICLLLQFL
jgi:hypothetical protein